MAVVYALHAQVIYDYRDITQKLVEAETWDKKEHLYDAENISRGIQGMLTLHGGPRHILVCKVKKEISRGSAESTSL